MTSPKIYEPSEIFKDVEMPSSPYELPQKLLSSVIKMVGFGRNYKLTGNMLAELVMRQPSGAEAYNEGRIHCDDHAYFPMRDPEGKVLYQPRVSYPSVALNAAVNQWENVNKIHKELASRSDDTEEEHAKRSKLLAEADTMFNTFGYFDLMYRKDPNVFAVLSMAVNGMIDTLMRNPLFPIFCDNKSAPFSVEDRMNEQLNYRKLKKYLDPESQDFIDWKYLIAYARTRPEYHVRAQAEIKKFVETLPEPAKYIPVELVVRRILQEFDQYGFELDEEKIKEACAPLL